MKLRWMHFAKKVSQKSPSKIKIGCVLINKKRLVSLGFNNMTKTSPRVTNPYHFIHAESHALIGTDYAETEGASLYVYRETLNGDMAHSRPCEYCLKTIIQSGIKKIYYTTPEGYKQEKL